MSDGHVSLQHPCFWNFYPHVPAWLMFPHYNVINCTSTRKHHWYQVSNQVTWLVVLLKPSEHQVHQMSLGHWLVIIFPKKSAVLYDTGCITMAFTGDVILSNPDLDLCKCFPAPGHLMPMYSTFLRLSWVPEHVDHFITDHYPALRGRQTWDNKKKVHSRRINHEDRCSSACNGIHFSLGRISPLLTYSRIKDKDLNCWKFNETRGAFPETTIEARAGYTFQHSWSRASMRSSGLFLPTDRNTLCFS